MRNLLIGLLCLSVAGCAHASKLVEKPFTDPQYGMTKQDLIGLEGKPESIEIYRKTDQDLVVFYIYTKKYQSSQQKVPVCLVDNRVVGWGMSYYEDHVSLDDTRVK